MMIQICPNRDAQCPHGYPCPFAIDRYDCKPEGLKPVKMLVDGDWLTRRVETDPDVDTDAG